MGNARDPFEYLDYRQFLRDFYARKKAEQRGFSYRAFSKRAGLRSPNHLKRVTDGERDLTSEMAVRYADACGLRGDAATYFCDLVAFNQAKTTGERNACYERLTGFRQYRKARKLELAHAAYHSKWFLPAIRELALRPDFRADASWIGRTLIPPISTTEAARALEVLVELGLLVERDGALRQGEAVVSTGPEIRGLHIANYHRSMMERAMGAIDLVEPAQRDISSITMCIPKGELARFKERIQAFRRELVGIASKFAAGDEVVQLNMQLFPLSRRRGEDEE